ncbi:hypothetical protein IJI70_01390 [Candidatus Saccharibacteria bacterium]|nr:hypothetical protein [Candidatus Saccharibacteria bacterium]
MDNNSYISSTGGENALLVSGEDLTLTSPTISKTGDESSENSDFYGTNAAVLVTSGTLKISGGSVETNASHANAVFAYSSGKIELENTSIKTSGNNSGGIMVTGGGTLTATNLSVETSGNSSAAIRSDRGGGTINVSGGSYTTSGVGSPAIYSTADIYISDGAELSSTSSEGVVIEGSNSVSLEKSSLTDTNVSLNGNSETYKNIFIYQSMSGDAKEGTGKFNASDSLITTNKGDTFFITNTTAAITLSNNKFVNTDPTGVFLRAGSGKWGTKGKNGGIVNLTLDSQVIEGDIVLNSISSLSLVLENESYYKGTFKLSDGYWDESAITASASYSNSLTLSKDSVYVLTGDTGFSSLENEDESNSNIYANGYNLYVAGEKVEVNESEAPAVPEVSLDSTSTETSSSVEEVTDPVASPEEISSSPSLALILSLSVCGVLLLGLIIFMILKLRKKSPNPPDVIIDQSTPPENPFK